MTETSKTEFYSILPLLKSFSELAESSVYNDIPDDWVLGMTDIIGSTKAVADGQYKTVNMVGAAAISAQINAMGASEFPFIFGGDGATFAVPADHWDAAAEQMAAVRAWAKREFDFELRAAMIPMSDISKAGHTISVARYSAAAGVDYAMFRGHGLPWAEAQMKSGNYSVALSAPDAIPNLTGLSCRWTTMPSKNGLVLSFVIVPLSQNDSKKFDEFSQTLIDLIATYERSGSPVPSEGPGVSWPPAGLALEAHASHGNKSLFLTKLKLLAETLLAWVFFKTRLKAGDFDPIHYQKTAGLNADFRKFEDGLKMTLDCSLEMKQQLIEVLNDAKDQGIIQYGVHEQDECMMTCIVPSIMTDDHIHFIDGANGGYTAAAEKLKSGS